jgi:hypothetical protein
MNRINVEEYRRLSGYKYEPEPEAPRPRQQAEPVRRQAQPAPQKMTEEVATKPRPIRQEIRELKTRLAALEERVEVVREDVQAVRHDQHGLRALIEDARSSVRTVYVQQEPRVVYRERPAQRPGAPEAAQMEAAIHRPPSPPKKPEPPKDRFSLLEVD